MHSILASILGALRRLSLMRALLAAAAVALLVGGAALAAVPGRSTAGSVRAKVYPDPCPGATVQVPHCLGGSVSDATTHAALHGAKVTLQHCVANVCTNVPPAALGLLPHLNPLTVGSQGLYRWNLIGGQYRLVGSKAGYVPPKAALLNVPPVSRQNIALKRAPAAPRPKGKCAGLKGKKLAACRHDQKVKRDLAKCNRFHGKKRAACRTKVHALA